MGYMADTGHPQPPDIIQVKDKGNSTFNPMKSLRMTCVSDARKHAT